ncbi:hypothetical protein BaRGS_00001597 [Batillaria attramentaria]|uniref:CIDE-N domain-containing protein n=1 Tax=Batillaria attramentaria TaxID=370345 RepID=A0ABD0M7J9_9CAEN
MSGFNGRPFKVWSAHRSTKKSLIASSLTELIGKGSAKLGISDANVRVVLEADGTEVDEEDYFSFLPSDATLMLLTPSDKWRPVGLEEAGTDETDYAGHPGAMSERTRQLVHNLKRDVSRIITFSDDDLNMVLAVDVSDLAHELGESSGYAKALQDACQRHLDERQQTAEALDLLRLYHRARTESTYVEPESGAGSKKRRHSPDQSGNV